MNKSKRAAALLYISCLFLLNDSIAQSAKDTTWWHGRERTIHYRPEGGDFVTVNGKRRFVRALYGTNTAFRAEAGDLPEFALYMPGMGGNFKFGIVNGDQSKWLIDAQYVKAVYRPGSMCYEIRDSLLGKGTMFITILALADKEGIIIKTTFRNVSNSAELVWAFGGATGKKFSRDGDIGADPESSFYLTTENCRDNSYTIDRNAFHLVYGSGKVLTEEERYEVQHLPAGDKPASADLKNVKQLAGLFPEPSITRLADASAQRTPVEMFRSTASSAPVVTGKLKITNSESYFLVQNAGTPVTKDYALLKNYFERAEEARKLIAGRVKVNTPDQYINTIGGALSVAADAIWEDPSYLHGAIAWRMRLNAWRGAYVADPLGWHDRARKHFSSYALSQVTTAPVTGVVMDTALHLARHQEKIGTALFSDGYICRNPNGDIRAHHYDMNLVFVDQLLNHFNWTGDTAYVKEMWPLIKRHLAWEKRNFDPDGDGLYDAYAAIWASDALQYSGGGVTHSSAYNYRANKTAAELATLIGEDGTAYRKEAEKIYTAVQRELWLPGQGSYAEYKDLLGKQLVHPSPGLWTIYHAIDARLPDPFQAYQNLQYIDHHIPHIPVKAKGLHEKGLYLLSTTNWQPYTWSINNVALAENLHTALAYWQGNRSDEAFRLWRSTIIESMYLGASPGGFQQLSFYDAIRGELYRDFADGIGVAGRTLVEGLFGILPDALHDTLVIQPGYPASWNHASLEVPDVHFNFKRSGNTDTYVIKQFFSRNLHLKFIVNAAKAFLPLVTVNGKPVPCYPVSPSVGSPYLQVAVPAAAQYVIAFHWKGSAIATIRAGSEVIADSVFTLTSANAGLRQIFDPQGVLRDISKKGNTFSGRVNHVFGKRTLFVETTQGSFTWWQPVTVSVGPGLPVIGINTFVAGYSRKDIREKVPLDSFFNDKVTNIFRHQYLSPRPKGPTLQLPTQGIGNWCYPLATANIDDRGVRNLAGQRNEIKTPEGVPFATPSDTLLNNIVYTSQWDNFPDSVSIPLSGNACEVHLLMAGSTNPMQSRMTNGMVIVRYTTGPADTLLLENPGSWWPIEQDYYTDEYAFTTSPWPGIAGRLYLKEGKFGMAPSSYTSIRGFSNRGIDGGAATVFNMILDYTRKLKSLSVHAVANDVVIGLMAATLER